MVVVTVLRVLSFVLHMRIVRECEGVIVTEMLVWETWQVCGWYT